jgi:hypothetical protein
MGMKLKKILLHPIALYSPVRRTVAWGCSIGLTRRLKREETRKLLDLLLRVMDWYFCLFKDYRKNIDNFEGRYLLMTRKGGFKSGVIFKDGDMKVQDGGIPVWDAKVTFEDPESLLKFILSRDQDLLELMLKNSMEMDGNINLILKFWFMVRDLKRRLGLAT